MLRWMQAVLIGLLACGPLLALFAYVEYLKASGVPQPGWYFLRYAAPVAVTQLLTWSLLAIVLLRRSSKSDAG